MAERNNALLQWVGIPIVSALVSFAAAWGALNAQISQNKSTIKELSDEHHKDHEELIRLRENHKELERTVDRNAQEVSGQISTANGLIVAVQNTVTAILGKK